VASLAAWDLDVSAARYVDNARAEALGRLGILSIRDLLQHYPFRYVDLTAVVPLLQVKPGTEVTVVGRVHDIKIKKPKPRLSIVEVSIVDGTGVMLGVWFNQPYMASRFVRDERVAFAGTATLEYGLKQMRNPFVEKLGVEDSDDSAARIVPVHRATEGLSTNWMRRLIGSALEDVGDVPDFLPAALRIGRDLIALAPALRDIHFPRSASDSDKARTRLAYEELLCLQLGMCQRRHRLTRETPGISHVIDGPGLTALRKTSPFEPTGDQARAIDEILGDMAAPEPMNRLLLGDVGTGKTLVAAHALCAAVDSGSQAAMMAPTEILAQQYAEKVGPLLDAAGVSWALHTGSTPASERKITLEAARTGALGVLFGTHALLDAKVEFHKLTLVIVDEQHRFGVGQRLGLRKKGASADLLVMTATPIPRSLALTLYGDLATSYLRERPNTAETRTTELVHMTGRERAYKRVSAAVAKGRQAYIVCALVDESDTAQAKAAVNEADRLARRVFSDLRVGLLTGRMKPSEKASVMKRFRAGEIDVLVSTTVIEVGIDVPNATVMIIEDADRFGLAQLHQLRGRIGRGEHAGLLMLFADPKTPEGKARMQAIVSTEDGFVLAEQDLALRGEGQVLGDRQHGLPELKLASLSADGELLDAARADAISIIESDPDLKRPEHGPLAEEVKRRFGAAWTWVSSG
ncbi:MAG: ATP-dependent DNA helicase RecG, partial [Actinobacteria bacterium]|nr:ATP-dependent DNA helicase RecG [Actinomycetota bacterium]MCG2807421.1 ATP-dependent DNA helicase RecG [Coriobacteriia bacterium]